MTDGRISWPRCRALDTHGGGAGILVDEELARAIRSEAAVAVRHWWGVGISTMVWWRRSLKVTRTNNPSSHLLVRCAAEAGSEASRARGLISEVIEKRRERELRHNLRRHLRPGGGRSQWTPPQLQLRIRMPDDEVADRIGRTVEAVRLKRQKLGILNPVERLRHDQKTRKSS